MTWVHECVFCGWSRPGPSATMLEPRCPSCGGVLRAVRADEYVPGAHRDDGFVAPRRGGDGTPAFAVLLLVPLLLPVVGVQLGDIAFLAPLVLTLFAAHRLLRAALADRRWSGVLLMWSAAQASAAAGSALATGAAMLNGDTGSIGFYVGAIGSACLLAGAVLLARRRMAGVSWADWVDAALLGIVVTGALGYFVLVPGFRDGDPALTGVVAIDVAALLLVGFSAVATRRTRHAGAEWWMALTCGAAVAGDGIVAAGATGTIPSLPVLVAALWAVAGFAGASLGEHGFDSARPGPPVDEALGRTWFVWRLLIPLGAVLALPATAAALALASALHLWGVIWFAILSVVALALAFGRQAHLLVERQRTVVRERILRDDVEQRNEELEALTGLATTMTQTLEEAPIVEQALGVLHAAARATSAALHVESEDGVRVAAATGAWLDDRVWAPYRPVEAPEAAIRGRRHVLRLPLAARGHHVGTVTLVRPADRPFDDAGVELLRLLVGQMAVAVQNARDYREKLEQAIRDPLTGVYNRRFLLEALEKEVQRSARYGSELSLVLFDVDDFKRINDDHGHGVGDDVLRRLAAAVEGVIRPVDWFARIGGEEFALLLPQTGQLQALMVADRVRTTIAKHTVLANRRVTVSGGVASCPADAVTVEDLQRRADAALYWAKRNGKNLCAVASEARDDDDAPSVDGAVAPLQAMAALLDARDEHSRDHSERVASIAVALGADAGMTREQLVKLRRAALLHDIGLVAVPAETLAKPGPLTEDEREQVRAHPKIGAAMLDHAGLIDEATWVRQHHERADGTGYPDQIAGDAVALEARILFVADAFEAMTAPRPHRSARTVDEAVAELTANAGTQFDAGVVAALARLAAAGELVSNQSLV